MTHCADTTPGTALQRSVEMNYYIIFLLSPASVTSATPYTLSDVAKRSGPPLLHSCIPYFPAPLLSFQLFLTLPPEFVSC